MKSKISIIALFFIGLTLVLATGFTLAQVESAETTVASDPDPATSEGSVTLLTMTSKQAQRLSPLHQQMREILILEESQLEELYKEFANETDSGRALAIQRRIHKVKTGTQVSLLTAQAKSARDLGRVEDAEQIERDILRLTNPDRVFGSADMKSARQ